MYGKCLPTTTLLGEQAVDTDSLLQTTELNACELGYTILPLNEELGKYLNRDKV